MIRSKRSAEKESFWRLVIDEHRRSGLTVRAFSTKEGLSEASLYAWRRKINERDTRQDVSILPSLVPVNVVDGVGPTIAGCEAVTSPPLEVVTPSGFTLRFQEGVHPERLDALLGVIARCHGGARPC